MKTMKTSTPKLTCKSVIRRQKLLAWSCCTLLVAGLLAFTSGARAAVISSPLIESFELDGNVAAQLPNPPDDWELLYNGGLNNGGSPAVFTGIVQDPSNSSSDDNFTSGSKID